MAYNNFLWWERIRMAILILSTPIIFVSCGGFKASQHPDDFFNEGRNISSLDELDAFMNSNNGNPQYRKAEVTTVSDPLRLKTEPDTRASSPSTGLDEIAKGEEVLVYWPLDVENNHIRVFVEGESLWVTYKSSSGKKYVTLQEDLFLPSVTSPGGFVYVRPGEFGPSNVPTQPLPGKASAFDIETIFLSSSALSEAHLAVREVNLTPAEVKTCEFNPLVGNNSKPDNCYEEIVISENFRNFIAQHGYACASEAARKTFSQTPQKILFHSSSAGQVKRSRTVSGTSKKSVHATGQALDLFGVSLFFNSTSSRKILMHINQTDGSSTEERQNHSFYWAYVGCWRGRIKQYAPCNCDTSLNGAITYQQNSAHHNHVHMSLPLCERSRFNVSCV